MKKSKKWLYITALVFAFITLCLSLISIINNKDVVIDKAIVFAIVFATLALVGNIILLANYLKKSSKSRSTFAVLTWLMSVETFGVYLSIIIYGGTTTCSLIGIIVSAILAILDFFSYNNEERRESDEDITAMQRNANNCIAKMRRNADDLIARYQ